MGNRAAITTENALVNGVLDPNAIGVYLPGDAVEFAKANLPTTDGFFFGGTGYDKYYVEMLEHTIDVCNIALEQHGDIYYHSSW